MTRLIYLSPVPWESFAQRPQKFVEWFHARFGGEVVWVDPYPTRLPRLSDLRRANPAKLQGKGHPEWMRVLKPLSLPLEPLPGSGWVNHLFWLPLLTQLERFASQQDTMVVIGKPSLLALATLKRLPQARSVYDAMDEFPAFYSGLSRRAFARREERVVRQVDTLWVTSTRLKRHWSAVRPDLQLLPNAVDDTLLPAPREKVQSPKKVFGYVGTIATWFDWDWVIALALERPQDVIRLIGPVFSPARATLPQNIELLPGCHHEAALQAMLDFDVGLIPFIQNELTASVDPIKYYEYRALGLPVISTKFGEMEFHAHEQGTFIVETLESLGARIESALNFQDDATAAREFAKRNSWRARFDAARIFP